MANDIVHVETLQLENELFSIPQNELGDESSELVRDLRQLHQLIVLSLQRDAYDLRLDTTQLMTLSLLAKNYINLRKLEATGGFTTPAQQKDYNLFVLTLTTEYTKMLRQARADARDALVEKFKTVMITTLDKLPDAKMKNALKGEFIKSLDEEGL